MGMSGLMAGSLEPQSLPQRAIILRDTVGRDLSLQVEVARTAAAREEGLMFRKTVTRGMLFVFDASQPLTFWMKNTLVPLDILFFADDGSLVSSTSMIPCVSDPCTYYKSAAPARYALEMPAGFVSKNRVHKGWKLFLTAARSNVKP